MLTGERTKKNKVPLIITFLLLAVGFAKAESTNEFAVLLISGAGVGTQDITRVTSHIETVLPSMDVRVEASDVGTENGCFDAANDRKREAQEIESRLKKKDVCGIVLYAGKKDSARSEVYPKNRVAYVNVSALVRDASEGEEEKAAERYGRWLEKEVLHALGICVGVESCPAPVCVLSDADTDDELDARARDYCPPCREKLLNRMREITKDVKTEKRSHNKTKYQAKEKKE